MAQGKKGTGPFSKFKKHRKPRRIWNSKLRLGLEPPVILQIPPVMKGGTPELRKVAPHSFEGRLNVASARILLEKAIELLSSVE